MSESVSSYNSGFSGSSQSLKYVLSRPMCLGRFGRPLLSECYLTYMPLLLPCMCVSFQSRRG